jgi:hypothetical protein
VHEIVSFVEAVLTRAAEENAAEEARFALAEADGCRIIDGGQELPYDDDGRAAWDVTDFRTGAVLATGHGSLGDCGRALQRLESELGQPLCHVEDLREEVAEEGGYSEMPPTSLPESLAECLRNWAWEYPGDAREWVTAQRAGRRLGTGAGHLAADIPVAD